MLGWMWSPPFLAILGFVGVQEWLVIGLVALLLFGSRLPKAARNLGRSLIEFKKGVRGEEEAPTPPDKTLAGTETREG